MKDAEFTRCGECKAWGDGTINLERPCLRRPPLVIHIPDADEYWTTTWPTTTANDGCFDGLPKDPAAAAECGDCCATGLDDTGAPCPRCHGSGLVP